MKRRDLIQRLEASGFRKLRDTGDHSIYFKQGSPPVSIPRHRELNENTANHILKDAGLK